MKKSLTTLFVILLFSSFLTSLAKVTSVDAEGADRVLVGQAVKTKANVTVFRMINKALK